MMNTTLRCLGFGRTAQAASTPAVLPSTFERKHMHQQVICPEEFIWVGGGGKLVSIERYIHKNSNFSALPKNTINMVSVNQSIDQSHVM